jgi:glycosyltransferase involved in cell wall biosynthesis
MRVSVAVPCYNGAKYLGSTIESLLQQSRPADEVLVIDDGSTDGSAEIARRYPVQVVFHGQNHGLATARNTAVKVAQGDILAFIDVDASADRDWLAHLIQPYEDESVHGVGGQGLEINIQSLADRWRQLHATQSHGESPRQSVDFLYGLNMSFRLYVLRQTGGFCTDLRTNAEDMDIGYRLNDAGFRLDYRPEARVYHQRQDSIRSLRRTMYNWYFWAFLIKRKNRRNPWTLLAGTVRRVLWSETWPDLFLRHSPQLSGLDVLMAMTKFRALLSAARSPLYTPLQN